MDDLNMLERVKRELVLEELKKERRVLQEKLDTEVARLNNTMKELPLELDRHFETYLEKYKELISLRRRTLEMSDFEKIKMSEIEKAFYDI